MGECAHKELGRMSRVASTTTYYWECVDCGAMVGQDAKLTDSEHNRWELYRWVDTHHVRVPIQVLSGA